MLLLELATVLPHEGSGGRRAIHAQLQVDLITTGAVSAHRHEVLMAQLAEKGLTGKGMEFYLESFKLGAPPRGGSGWILRAL